MLISTRCNLEPVGREAMESRCLSCTIRVTPFPCIPVRSRSFPFSPYRSFMFPLMRLSVAGREQQKNTNYAFRALRAVQLLSQVCGITATQLCEAIAVA